MSETSLSADSENQSLRKIEKDSSIALGQYGATYKNNAGYLDATVGPWAAIQALEAANIELETGTLNWDGSGTTNGIAIPAGATIYGNFAKIRVLTGRIVAYKQSR
jgi:hypothetical protein